MHLPRIAHIPAGLALLSVLAGCGSSNSTSHRQANTSANGQAGALSADARSAATGDIPDTQAFLLFTNRAGGYSIKYPEGWTQKGSGSDVTLSDKNNVLHVVIGNGGAPTASSVTAELQALKRSDPTLSFKPPHALNLPSGPAVRATYTTQSRPNPVTGKRVTLLVDRYVVRKGARIATVDLGTPKGVDNVDAYRMMIRSFRWL